MNKPVYIASDVHLGAVPRETERAFLRFLEHVGAHASSLLIPGDLFDFWFEYGDVVPGEHFRVLAALASLVEAGVPVTMVGGNHDAWGGRFLSERVGMTFTSGELRTTLGGKPALVVHGDGVGRGDFKYRALKAVIRGRLAVGAFRALHPELGLRLARRVSSTETHAESDEGSRGRARYIEAWARSVLAAEPELGFVVCGHAHLPALVEVAAGRWYVNAGDWVRHFTYVKVSGEGAPEMCTWDVREWA